MHTVIEEQMDMSEAEEKDIRWEALREQCMTIGAREALDRAMKKGNILIEYLWFIIVLITLIVVLNHWVQGCDGRDPAAGSHIPAEVKGGHSEGLR